MRRADGKIRKTRQSTDIVGQAHELTFSCYHRLPLLSKDRTRQWLVESIARARVRLGFDLWAFVIMPDHVHMLVLPRRPSAEVADILRGVKQPVARSAIRYLRDHAPSWIIRLKGTRADGRNRYHFWQPGGGYDRNIINAGTAWASVEYIHRNPVRKGLVESPQDWTWSSAHEYAGLDGSVLKVDGHPPDL